MMSKDALLLADMYLTEAVKFILTTYAEPVLGTGWKELPRVGGSPVLKCEQGHQLVVLAGPRAVGATMMVIRRGAPAHFLGRRLELEELSEDPRVSWKYLAIGLVDEYVAYLDS